MYKMKITTSIVVNIVGVAVNVNFHFCAILGKNRRIRVSTGTNR